MEAVAFFRWEPLTLIFVLASAWWVKWPLFTALGALTDASRRVRLPYAALAAGSAAAVAGLAVGIVKELVDRPRPAVADPTLGVVGVLPDSASFPSGHAATAFAAAVAVGLLHPRLRRLLFGLAAIVAVSRVYLGMHYVSDVLIGSLLGAAIGLCVGILVRRLLPGAPTSPASPAA